MDNIARSVPRSQYWNDYRFWAERYDRDVHHRMQYCGHTKVAEKITPFLRTSASRHVADLGTGTGLVLDLLRRDFPAAVLDGYDFSPAMLDKCRAKNLADSLTECDLTDRHWPIHPGSVDFVTSSGLLEMIENADQFLRNVQGILKPCGIAALTYEVKVLTSKTWRLVASNEARHPGEMDILAQANGFDVISHDQFRGYVANGRQFQYGILTLHKPAP